MAITTEQDLEIALFTHGHDGSGLAKAFHTVLNSHPANASLTLPKTVHNNPIAMQALLNAMDRLGPDDTIKMSAPWLAQVALATAMHAKNHSDLHQEEPQPALLSALGILTDALYFSTAAQPAIPVKPRKHSWQSLRQDFDSTLKSFLTAQNLRLKGDFKLAPPTPTVEVKPGVGAGFLRDGRGGGVPAGRVYCR